MLRLTIDRANLGAGTETRHAMNFVDDCTVRPRGAEGFLTEVRRLDAKAGGAFEVAMDRESGLTTLAALREVAP